MSAAADTFLRVLIALLVDRGKAPSSMPRIMASSAVDGKSPTRNALAGRETAKAFGLDVSKLGAHHFNADRDFLQSIRL